MNEKHKLTIFLLKLFDLTIVVSSFAVTTILIVEEEHAISVARFLSKDESRESRNIHPCAIHLPRCLSAMRLVSIEEAFKTSRRDC